MAILIFILIFEAVNMKNKHKIYQLINNKSNKIKVL